MAREKLLNLNLKRGIYCISRHKDPFFGLIQMEVTLSQRILVERPLNDSTG